MKVYDVSVLPFVAVALMGSFRGDDVPDRTPPLSSPVIENRRVESLVGPVLVKTESHRHSERAHPHPHGDQVCASGCALSRHPTKRLTAERFEELIRRIAADANDTAAIDELLYFGPQAKARLQTAAVASQLQTSTLDVLTRELEFNAATVALRLVSDSGTVLADLPDQLVRLDLRHEFDLQEHNIPPLLASGTVKRVGRYRLWGRL